MKIFAAILLLAPLFQAPGALAQAEAQQPSVAARPRSPAQVMSFRGADWLERPQRVSEERPDEVLRVMALEPGDVVADVGAGSGYFTRRMARAVAPGGTVFAVDVQNEMLDMLMENITEEGLTGVVPLLSTEDDPLLPPGTVDWILLVDVYHEFAQPVPMLERMRASLAPGGRVALVEYRAEDETGEHIRAEHRMSARQVLAEWEAAGFGLVELHEFLPSQHIFVLAPSGGLPAAGVVPSTAGALPRIPHHDLAYAVRAGLVEISPVGRGSDGLSLSIRRTRPVEMVVTLPAGATFEATGAAGDMIARRDGMIHLREDGPQTWRLAARKADPAAPAPGPSDRLELRAGARPDVEGLMWLLQGTDVFPAVAPTVEQIALWIVTADLGWDALSAHAQSTSVHAANAVALASAYVNGSGVDIRTKRIWAERESFVSQISDQGLQRIFAELDATR
jgi:predicted methyltransferase